MHLNRQIIFIIFFIVNRQSSIVKVSSIVNRQARGPGSLMSKKVDNVQKSGQSDLKIGHVQNIGQ
jgi:hypothetical protein